MSLLTTPAPTSDGVLAAEPVIVPDERTVAFAISVVQSKPPELSIEEYIKLLRQHIAGGRRENALSTVYSHLDRSAYWRSEADRANSALKVAQEQAIELRREIAALKNKLDTRPSNPVRKRKKPDEDVIPVPRSPKKSKRAASPDRRIQTVLGFATDVEFSPAGEIGDTLLRSVFDILAILKAPQRTRPIELLHHIVRASSVVPQIVQREVERIVTEEDLNNEQLKTALTLSSRTIATIMAGFTRLNHARDAPTDTAVLGQAVYAIVSMFRSLLGEFSLLSTKEVDKVTLDDVSVTDMRPSTASPCSPVKSKTNAARPSTARPSTARPSTARPFTASTTGPDKTKTKSKGRGPQCKDRDSPENATLSLYAAFLGQLIDMLDPKVEANEALFEGFAYCVLDRVGKRLYRVVFGHDRAVDLETEIKQSVATQEEEQPNGPSSSSSSSPPTPLQPGDMQTKQIKLEAPCLLRLLTKIMVAAPAHLGNVNGVRNSKTKYSSKTLAKNTLALSAKECLQRTLVVSMFGQEADEVDDPFKECLRMPIASEGLVAMPKVKDEDVIEHFKEEAWRCLGWEILAKEGQWDF